MKADRPFSGVGGNRVNFLIVGSSNLLEPVWNRKGVGSMRNGRQQPMAQWWVGAVTVWMIGLAWMVLPGYADEPTGLPADVLGRAEREMGTARSAAGLDPLERAREHTQFANEVLVEVRARAAQRDAQGMEALLTDYRRHVEGALDGIAQGRAQGRDVGLALEAVERSTKRHTEVLTGLLDEVPEEARPAIQHSIEVSQRGRNTALSTLESLQRVAIPAGPVGVEIPSGQVGPPSRIGPPEGVGRPLEAGPPAGIGAERSGRRGESGGRPSGVPGGAGRGGNRGQR